jgi:hypothetical protein
VSRLTTGIRQKAMMLVEGKVRLSMVKPVGTMIVRIVA